MRKSFITYLFKNRKIAILFFGILYFALVSLTAIRGFTQVDDFYSRIMIGFLISSGITMALPVIQFAFVHQKKSVDAYFSLPYSRKEILHTNLFFIWLIAFGYFLIAILFNSLFVLGKLNLLHFLGLLVVAGILLACLTLSHSVIYLLANNIFDGIVMLGAYAVLTFMLIMLNNSFITNMVAGKLAEGPGPGIYLSPLYLANTFIESYGAHYLLHEYYGLPWLALILVLVYGLLAYYGLLKEFVHRKTERAEQISNGFFAYPLIIHAYLFIILAMIDLEFMGNWDYTELLLPLIVLFFVYIVACFVYQRKIELKAKHLLMFGLGMLLSAILAVSAWTTRGFGISDYYRTDLGTYITYEYHANVLKKNLEIASNDWENNVNIHAELWIHQDEKGKYKEVIDMLESKRRDAIDYFYARKPENYYNSMLNIYNETSKERRNLINPYYYTLRKPLTMEELELLNQYVRVSVSDNDTGETYSLEEYLKKGE